MSYDVSCPLVEYSYCDQRRGTYLFRKDLLPLKQDTIYRVICHHCNKTFLGLSEITDNTNRVATGCLGILNGDKRVRNSKSDLIWTHVGRKYLALHSTCKAILETAPEI